MAMKNNIFIFVILCFILSAISASANIYCPGYSCSNQYALGQYQDGCFGSYAPGYSDFTTYLSCATENSLFDPVSGDLDYDGEMEYVIVTSNTRLVVYNSRCVIENTLNLNKTILSSPAIIKSGRTTDDYELMLLTNGSLMMLNSSSLATIAALDSNFTGHSNFGCDKYYCFARNASTKLTIMKLFDNYDATSNVAMTVSYSTGANVLPGNPGKIEPSTQGVAVLTEPLYDYSSVIYCGVNSSTASEFQCKDVRSDGYISPTAMVLMTGVGDISSIYQVQAQKLYMDGVARIFLYGVAEKGANNVSGRQVYSDTYSSLKTNAQVCGNSTNSWQCINGSNWMVQDYDKDGFQEACVLIEANQRMICYSNQFTTAKYNISVNTSSATSHYVLMADINKSKPYMHLADKTGIYYTASNLTLYSSGLDVSITDTRPITSLNNDRTAVLPVFHFIGTPQIYYVSTTESLLTIQNSSVTTSCGDGVCTQGENYFSCPADCFTTLITDGSCSSDQDCYLPGYPYNTCLGGVCVAGASGVGCIQDSDCPFNASICYENQCIQGVSNTSLIAGAQTDIQVSMTYWIDRLLAGSSFIKMFIAMVLIIGAIGIVYGSLASHHPGQAPSFILPLFAGFAMMVFCTAFGLIPIWVIIIMILSTIAIFILFKLIFSSGATGG
jgi:hypothetical protein